VLNVQLFYLVYLNIAYCYCLFAIVVTLTPSVDECLSEGFLSLMEERIYFIHTIRSTFSSEIPVNESSLLMIRTIEYQELHSTS
jgi:hypothetical protein